MEKNTAEIMVKCPSILLFHDQSTPAGFHRQASIAESLDHGCL